MLRLGKPNFKTKIIPFEKSHKVENCKRISLMRFLNIHFVAKFKKNKGTFRRLRKIFGKKNKKMRNFNSLIVPENLKTGPFGIFNIRSVVKYEPN